MHRWQVFRRLHRIRFALERRARTEKWRTTLDERVTADRPIFDMQVDSCAVSSWVGTRRFATTSDATLTVHHVLQFFSSVSIALASLYAARLWRCTNNVSLNVPGWDAPGDHGVQQDLSIAALMGACSTSSARNGKAARRSPRCLRT